MILTHYLILFNSFDHTIVCRTFLIVRPILLVSNKRDAKSNYHLPPIKHLVCYQVKWIKKQLYPVFQVYLSKYIFKKTHHNITETQLINFYNVFVNYRAIINTKNMLKLSTIEEARQAGNYRAKIFFWSAV